MALPPPTPPQERVFKQHTNAVFSSLFHTCEKRASLAYKDRKQLQDKPIIA